MKSIILKNQMIWKFYMISVMILSCSFSSFAETEPNNSRETANAFALNSTMTGSFSQADGSSDYFKLVTTSDGKLEFTLTSDQTLCVDLVLMSENGQYNLHHNGYCSMNSHTNKLTINNLGAGTYYLVADRTGNGNYSITNTFVASALQNDTEPNDSRATAMVFPLNSEKTGHLGYKVVYADTEDYYKVTTNSDGKLKFKVVADASLCVDLTLMSENGLYNLFTNGYCSSSNHLDTLVVPNLAAGTYYILASANGYGSYRLTNSFIAAKLANDVEPNDLKENAIPLTTNTSTTGHLGYKMIFADDKDYYKIVTTGNINLSVAIAADPTLCVELVLQNSDGSLNLANNGYCGNSNYKNKLEKNSLAPGTYYLVAYPTGYGSYQLTTSYTFISSNIQFAENEIVIYPNPAKKELFIHQGNRGNVQVRIFNLSGQVVFSKEIPALTEMSCIDVSDLKSGTYLFELRSNDQIRHGKFIKE